MIDNILQMNIKGHAMAQVFNAAGEVIQQQEKDNFIGIGGQRFFMNAATAALKAHLARSDVARFFNTYSTPDPFEKLKLTDNTASVATDAGVIPGTTIGYAIAQIYVGEDTQRGTPNTTESQITTDSVKLVFDFATNAANGTFQTIGFEKSIAAQRAGKIIAQHATSARALCVDDTGENIYFASYTDNKLVKYNFATQTITTVSTTSIGSPIGMAYYDNKVYYNVDNGTSKTVSVVDLATGAVSVFKTGATALGYGMACDGTYFYIHYYSTNCRFYKYDLAFNYIELKTIPPESVPFTIYNGLSIVNPGWFMFGCGDELNIADIFLPTPVVTYRRNLNCSSSYGQIVKGPDGIHYQGDGICFVPSLFESSGASGYADGSSPYITSGCGDLPGSYVTEAGDDKGLGSCVVLVAPVTKNNTQTMKITYTFTLAQA